MRKLLALTLTVLTATFVSGGAEASAPALAASGATVTTDKTDYQPGETVVISGSGWAAGETVSLTLTEDPARHAETTLSASADEYGNILNKEFSPTREHVGMTFTLTAVGQASSRTATATFTDGGAMNYAPNNQTLNIQSDASPQSASFSQTVSAPRGNGTFNTSLQVTGTGLTPLPAGWVSTSPASLSFATGTGTPTVFFSRMWNVTVTVPPFTPAGTYTGQIRANPSVGGLGIGSGTSLSVVVTADNAPPNTLLSAVKADTTSYNGVDWTNQDVTITLSATDTGTPATGVASTQYKIDLGSYQTYTAPFTISTEGLHTVTYLSTDNSGNVEGGQTFTVKIDKTAPAPNCGSADGTWHDDNVSITCSPSDSGGSGLVSPGDLTLTTSVADGTEEANASTNSQQVCDNAGNCATAGPINGNMVDKKAPVINITTPLNGASYLLNQMVASAYTVTDGGSGVASSTPASGSALDTATVGSKTFAVTATDNVGNQSNASASYTVGYGVVALYDQSKSVKRGATIPIKIRLVDANGANVSSPAIVVSALKLVIVGGGASDAIISDQNNANGDGNFRYDASLGGYIFNLSTRNMGLVDGTWRLDFAPAGDPVAHSVFFGVVR